MRLSEIANEAWTFGKMPQVNQQSYQSSMIDAMSGAVKIKDISNSLSIYKNGNRYILVKNQIPIGHIQTSTKNIHDKDYTHIDGLYVMDKFQKTSTAGFFIYALKELISPPLIADGAIFNDAYELFKNNKLFKAQVLDMTSGKTYPLTDKINDSDKCYIFDSTNLDFKYKITESTEVYIPFFEDVD